MAKINAKSTDHSLKLQLNDYIEQGPGSRCIGPINLALSQEAEMQQATNISINMIQPEPAYNPGDLVRTIQQPNYWSQLGSSKIEHQCNKKWAKILSMNFVQKPLIGYVLLSQIDHVWRTQDPVELAQWYSFQIIPAG